MPDQNTPVTPAEELVETPAPTPAVQPDAAGAQPNPNANPAPSAIPSAPAQPPLSTSGLAVAGLVLGIIAVVTSFIPIVNNASFVIGIVGLALAIAGHMSIKKGAKTGQGIAIAGIVLGIVSIVIVLLMQSMCAAMLGSMSSGNRSAASSTASSTASSAGTAAESSTDAASSAASSAAAAGEASASGQASSASQADAEFEVTIDDARVTEDYKGNPAIIVSFTWTNNSDETRSFASTLHPKCFQDGVQLESAIVRDLDSNGFMADVRPGYGTSLEMAYSLAGDSSVEVEVTRMISLDKAVLASRTFDLS